MIGLTKARGRVLICDDRSENYLELVKYLSREGFDCADRVERVEELRSAIEDSHRNRKWFEFIMIDIDLSFGSSKRNGIDYYYTLQSDFPHETYILYTSQGTAIIREMLNDLLYRNVELVLLEEVVKEQNIRWHLSRIVNKSKSDKVFLVHGRNAVKAAKMKRLLDQMFGLEVIDWESARSRVPADQTIFEIVLKGIEMSGCTVVLLTDDEESELRKDFQKDTDRAFGGIPGRRRLARPNVYLEAGYAFGIRGSRTLFVEWPDSPGQFESPTDLGGYPRVFFDDTPQLRDQFRQILESARCRLNLSVDWQTGTLGPEV